MVVSDDEDQDGNNGNGGSDDEDQDGNNGNGGSNNEDQGGNNGNSNKPSNPQTGDATIIRLRRNECSCYGRGVCK